MNRTNLPRNRPSTRKTIKKIEKVKRKKYSKESLELALAAIDRGMSKKLAAKTYNVPRSTLQFRKKFPNKKSRPGPATILTPTEETTLVNWLIDCGRKGFPKRKEDLIASVADFIKKDGRPNPFSNGVPGIKWYRLFLERHPELAIRTPEAVTSASAAVAKEDIKGWFKEVYTYLKTNNLLGILDDPKRIYNGDETNFVLCPKTGTVLAAKGEKNVYEIDHAAAKTSLTVLFNFGADGSLTPPLVIFPYKRLPSEISSKVPSDWGIGLSDNGWMKAEIFIDYVQKVFYPYLIKVGVKFPVILYVDGHKTHLTYELSKMCSSLEIILIALYPNCTRILQPADVSAFKPLKVGWQKTVLAWRREHPSEALTKTEFVPLLKKTIDETMNPSIIVNGFRATGLYPFNENSIDYTKCLGKKNDKNADVHELKSDQINMTVKDFKQIVGETQWQLLQNSDSSGIDESLRKIFIFFTSGEILKDPQNSDEAQQTPTTTNVLTIENSALVQRTDIENMDIIISDENEHNLSSNIEYMDSQPHFIKIIHCAEIHNNDEKDKVKSYKNLTEATHNSKIIKQSKQQLVCSDDIEILSSEEVPIELFSSDIVEEVKTHKNATEASKNSKIIVQTEQQIVCADGIISSEEVNLGSFSNITPVKLKDILVLPKTPKRKGTRTTTKVPFAITSAEWKDLELKKIKVKEEKADGIKKRKEERERKKTEKIEKMKENKENKRLKKQLKNDSDKVVVQKSSELDYTIKINRNTENVELEEINLSQNTISDNNISDCEEDGIQENAKKKRKESKKISTEDIEDLLNEEYN